MFRFFPQINDFKRNLYILCNWRVPKIDAQKKLAIFSYRKIPLCCSRWKIPFDLTRNVDSILKSRFLRDINMTGILAGILRASKKIANRHSRKGNGTLRNALPSTGRKEFQCCTSKPNVKYLRRLLKIETQKKNSCLNEPLINSYNLRYRVIGEKANNECGKKFFTAAITRKTNELAQIKPANLNNNAFRIDGCLYPGNKPQKSIVKLFINIYLIEFALSTQLVPQKGRVFATIV